MPNNKVELDQNMKDNILKYNDQIKTIDSFVEAVRQTIGMYIGRRGNRGFMNLIREVYQNSIDEMLKPDSPCDHINVHYSEIDHWVIISDNGRGIPFNNIIRIFTSQHTSSNYVKKGEDFSSGMNGVGAKVTNALSDEFIVESFILGEGRRVEFKDGKPWNKGEAIIKKPDMYQGTRISFHPSYEVLGQLTLTAEEVFNMVKVILSLTQIGSGVTFGYTTLDGVEHVENIVNEDGIITDLIINTKSPLIAPIRLSRAVKGENMKAELAFNYDTSNLDGGEHVTSFANFCPTEAGTHVDGLIDGIVTFFRNYMNKIYLANNKKVSVTAADIKTGLRAVISVAHLEPIFSGQAKEVLNNEDMTGFVKNLVISGLDQWIKQNPNDLQKLCKFFKDVAEVRLKSEEGKVKVQRNYEAKVNGDPAKFLPSYGTKTELLIVEGDSALGSARNSRNKNCQAIFPIRGKVPNALDTPKEKFLKNAEISAIIQIVSNNTLKYGKNFDPKDCPWEYIIFGADADPDGAHINSLLLYFFALYFPTLVEAGRVYKAVPPLYGATVGKERIYFTNNLDFTVYVQNIFMKNNTLTTETGQKLTKNEITELFVTLGKYTDTLERIALNFALDPEVLEFFLFNLDKDFKTLKALAKKEYRFLENDNKFELVNGCPTGSWLVNNRMQILHLNQMIIDQCAPVLDMIHHTKYNYYRLNGERVSLYKLMLEYKRLKPKNITRYKGLGEMDPEELAESTISPTTARTLVRYTMEDAKEQIERIRYINSNKSELLKNIKISPEDID